MIHSVENPFLFHGDDEKHLEVDIALKSGEKFSVMLSSDGNGWTLKEENNKMLPEELREEMSGKVKEMLSFQSTKLFLKHSERAERTIESYCSGSFLNKIDEMEKVYLKSLS